MDFWGIFMFFLLAFLIMSCCGYCCSRKQQGAVLSAPVVVTSATHTAPGGYPVTQIPISSSTTAYQTHVYAAPYPQQGAPTHIQMPMPMPGGQPPAPGMQPYVTPYPPMPMAGNMNPPSYDMATAAAGSGQQNTTTYEKQSAYNPNYQM